MVEVNAIYKPREYYSGSQGFTKEVFEGRSVQKATPVEDGIIYYPGAAASSVMVYNGTGHEGVFQLSHSTRLNPKEPATRQNTKEIDALIVPAGQGCHFPVETRYYTVTVGENVKSEKGMRYNLTTISIPFNNIRDQNVEIFDGDEAGLLDFSTTPVEQNNYTSIRNKSSKVLRVSIHRNNNSYEMSEEEEQLEIKSRKPDLGPKLIESVVLDVNARYYTCLSMRQFIVRFLSTETGVNNSSNALSGIIPQSDDYVVESSCVATKGMVVVAFRNKSGTGVDISTYQYSEIKPVASGMVVTRVQNR